MDTPSRTNLTTQSQSSRPRRLVPSAAARPKITRFSQQTTMGMFIWLVLLTWLASSIPTASAAQYEFTHCDDKCEEHLCPELNYCEGVPLKDSCNCCMICSDNKYQPHARNLVVASSGGEACKQVRCPRFKICTENMQGLPLCKCPSTFFCRKKKKREICAMNGITYPSRCHMRIASCNLGSAVRKNYRGPCTPEKDRKMRRRRLRLERKKARGDDNEEPKKRRGDKKAARRAEKERQKRKRTNRKRRKIGGRRSRGKRRIRKHKRHNNVYDSKEASRAFEEAFAHYTWSK